MDRLSAKRWSHGSVHLFQPLRMRPSLLEQQPTDKLYSILLTSIHSYNFLKVLNSYISQEYFIDIYKVLINYAKIKWLHILLIHI